MKRQTQTIIGYDPASPGGDESSMVIGHKDEKGRIVIDRVLRGGEADKMAIICETKARASYYLARRRNAFDDVLKRIRRGDIKFEKKGV